MKAPVVKNMLGCTEYDYEKITENAYRMLRKNTSGYRGQTITMYDSIDYWMIVATREYYR